MKSAIKISFIRIIIVTVIIMGHLPYIVSQADSRVEDFIEKYIEIFEENEEVDLYEIREIIEYRLENPLNINFCDESELRELMVLNEHQIRAFMDYRASLGRLISIYELQAVPLFDLMTIEIIVPLVTVGRVDSDYQASIPQMIRNSKRELRLKTKTFLEDKAGFLPGKDSIPKYAGDKMTYYTRFRLRHENRLSIGMIAEKDPGELFFKGYNKYGFDFYTAHFFLYKKYSWLKELNIGDYTASLGQGLIMHNDFGRGKSALVTNIKKNAQRVIRPYNSVNENMYLRGFGATFVPVEKLEISVFGSYAGRDANVQALETDYEDFEVYVSSLQTSGFHRTTSEIANKNSVRELSFGNRIMYKTKNGYVGANMYSLSLDKPLIRSDHLYNRYRFSGDRLFNLSADYSQLVKNVLFFGELARSRNNAYAFIQGIQFVPSVKLDIALLYRNYSRAYESINSNSFGETVGTNNEEGLYMGINYRFSNRWSLSMYHDIWKFPWLRFNTNTTTYGNEFFMLLKYTIRRKFNFYTQFKSENKAANASHIPALIRETHQANKKRLRFHTDYKINGAWELRNRVEFSSYSLTDISSSGFMIYQDVIFRPVGFPLRFSMRYAIFDTDDFNTAIYAYENDLLGESYIPAYHRKGYRTYINVRYRPDRNSTFEFRWGRWYYPDEKSLGSGNEYIDTNRKTEVKAQLRMNF